MDQQTKPIELLFATKNDLTYINEPAQNMRLMLSCILTGVYRKGHAGHPEMSLVLDCKWHRTAYLKRKGKKGGKERKKRK